MSNIFISYSHKDEDWKDKLVTHLKVLEMEDYYTLWDDRKIKVGNDWFLEVEKELNDAQIVIMLITANFLISNFIRKEEVHRILKRRQKEGVRVIPIIVKPCAWKSVQWLASIQVTPKDGKPLSTEKEYEIDEELANLAESIASIVKRKGITEPKSRFIPLPPEQISTFNLPTTGEQLFGREERLKELDEAWVDEHIHVVAMTAWGGVGKTSLVNHWLNKMGKDNYRGAKRVYGWSFYSQGAEEGKQASADEFMQETLKWFGDEDPTGGSAVEKGRRLAHMVRKERTLLILDGMEPLQYPPGEVHGLDGKLKDQGMRAFLRELASGHPGLCIITSREKVTDLADKMKYTVKEMELEHLSDDAGSQLLKSLGVTGSHKEIVQAVKEYDGHALALTLLGQYIKSVYKGDIRKRDKIPKLTKERTQGCHACRVMEAYERWLGDSPEKNILYIMGLFDRPVEKGAIDALKAEPPIFGVTGKLQKLTEEDLEYALINLRTANLLAKENLQNPGALDCHPLIREYFGQKFQEQNPNSWKEAHKRLYHYYKNLPEKELPDTLLELEPLFAAVSHGCRAGFYQEVLHNVYWERISRREEYYCTNKLGSFGADLMALSHFFKVPWNKPIDGLTEYDRAAVLSLAAFRLRALGRLQEAIDPLQMGLESQAIRKDWKNAAKVAGNLSELMLILGQVSQAVNYARQSVTYADRSREWEQKVSKRATLANALHQSGQIKEAEKWFHEAESIQKDWQPQYPFLYSLKGSRYCDLLLAKGKYWEVTHQAKKALEIAKRNGWLLAIALDKLKLGQAWEIKAQAKKTSNFRRAMDLLTQAVEGLREAGTLHELPPALFVRAECYRRQKQFSNAWDDLKEAEEIATLGSMKLYLVDYHLEAGRLCKDEGKVDEAKYHFETAARMIKETGYHRRDGEV